MTFTKEWLQQTISEIEEIRDEIPFGLDEHESNMLEVLKFALAALTAPSEPVARRLRYKDGPWLFKQIGEDGPAEECYTEQMLYIVPPAPVVPEEMTIDTLPDEIRDSPAASALGWMAGWNAFLAAMLQGAEPSQPTGDERIMEMEGLIPACDKPVSQHDGLPLDYLQGRKDGLEWAARLAEASHPQTSDWLYDDPLELAKAIRKGPDMPEAVGKSPVIPDGYALVPVEPTMAVLDEFDSIIDHGAEDSKDARSRLLAAAAQPE